MFVKQIGRYEIIRELGQGSMAIVFLGKDPFMQRQVAIKMMSPDLADDTFHSRFRYEAELLANIEHPYIVPIYDFGIEQKQMYIVMRYMTGGTLTARIRHQPLPIATTVATLSRIAAVLDTIHARGVIHRDLKPGNILFDAENNAFLADFGIAKNIVQSGGLTATDVILGTVDYMSPEQIQGRKDIDGRSDVYALGILLFYMLTGRLPFQKETVIGTALAHLGDPIPSVEKQLPQGYVAWDHIFKQALAKERDDRYATAGAMLREVKSLLAT